MPAQQVVRSADLNGGCVGTRQEHCLLRPTGQFGALDRGEFVLDVGDDAVGQSLIAKCV
ncbi:hypothetical protein [Amycolatopsis sp. WGS_07]|uniref:hypothetical protein n=1 Tax=Amycolatopsis sp. WGS_07 TaxID=3076764 RepID=UPI003873AB20